MTTIQLIGVPIDLGAGRRGTDMGPSALRLTPLADRLAGLGHTVRDAGNIAVPIPESCDEGDPRQRYAGTIAEVCGRLAAQTRAAAEGGAIPLVLGGDHSLAMGSVGGVAAARRARNEPMGVIWIDAHGDINTPETSPSGNVHGMPLAALLGQGPPLLTEIAGPAPALSPERTVLFGLRDIDPEERRQVRRSGVRAITMTDIDRHGIGRMAEEAITTAGAESAAIYVSLDLDGVDPSVAPGVGTPVRGGLSYREAHLLMELVAESGRLCGMDLVEVNPSLDQANATAQLAAELALSGFGQRIL